VIEPEERVPLSDEMIMSRVVVLIVAAKKTDSLDLGTARQAFLEYAQKPGGGVRLRRDAMSIDATRVSRLFRSDQRRDENDRRTPGIFVSTASIRRNGP